MKYYFFLYGIDAPYPYYKECKNDRGAKIAFRAAMKKYSAAGGYVNKTSSRVVDNVLRTQLTVVLAV